MQPAGASRSDHFCRFQATRRDRPGYGPIARVLSRTPFDRYLLECDDERSGDFEPLREVPEDRVVVLGLVTTKRPRLEDEETLTRRIAEAAASFRWSGSRSVRSVPSLAELTARYSC